MHVYGILCLASAALVTAWLPGEQKNITARDGTNLFEATPSWSYGSSRSVTGRSATKRWLPASGKIRGVNLGSMFVFEPWLAENEWNSIGCGPYKSEFDCVSGLGQAAANAAFQKHWNTWITQSDISQMQSYGLNTIRIPVGYWMREDIVYSDSEHFPQGGLTYLERLCGWASDAGFYIIIDLHGAPGAQVAQNPDTGQYAPSPGFYVDYQFERALKFLEWMTTNIHTNSNFRNVGMLEIVNEPVQNPNSVGNLLSSYYPNAFTRIRAAESALGITANNYLHIQMMNPLWGSGSPRPHLPSTYFAAYDDHRYLKWSGIPTTQASYLSTSCSDNRGAPAGDDIPTVVGEFSLSVPDDVQWTAAWDPATQQAFYKKWFAAQVIAYERQLGWVFWSWKNQLGDWRWGYQGAVQAGVVPVDLNGVYKEGAC